MEGGERTDFQLQDHTYGRRLEDSFSIARVHLWKEVRG